MSHTVRSPYLLGIALFILLYSVTSTILYFQQATIADANFPDRAGRTAFFADIDLWVNVLTLVVQLLLTGRLMGRMGVALTLCALPFVSVAGFAALASSPGVTTFVVVQVARRVSNFAWPGRRGRSCSPPCRARTATRRRTSSTPSSTAAATRSEAGSTPA